MNNEPTMTSIDFTKINIPVPENVLQLSIDHQTEIFNYLSQLDDIQKKAYLIARNHLGSSFNVYKSIGFKEWKKINC